MSLFLTGGHWSATMRSGQLCAIAAPTSTPAWDRSRDEQSYDQTNTGALIRPACSSTNPGIQGAVLTLPQRPSAPGRRWSRGSNVNTEGMFGSNNGILSIESEEKACVQKGSKVGVDWPGTDFLCKKLERISQFFLCNNTHIAIIPPAEIHYLILEINSSHCF